MRKTIVDFQQMKARGERIAMLTAYDSPMARLLDAAGVPALLVGDSVGNTVLGYTSTIPVTLDDMVRHTAAVVRGTQSAMIIADLPFLSYTSEEQALASAQRLLQQGGAQADGKVLGLHGARGLMPEIAPSQGGRLAERGVAIRAAGAAYIAAVAVG